MKKANPNLFNFLTESQRQELYSILENSQITEVGLQELDEQLKRKEFPRKIQTKSGTVPISLGLMKFVSEIIKKD